MKKRSVVVACLAACVSLSIGACMTAPSAGPPPAPAPVATAAPDATPAPLPPPAANPPPATPPSPPTGGADGATCLAAADCASGICEGQGCDTATPGKCMPRARMCTQDYREYCGCDKKVFHGSGSCPGKRYLARGACPP
jgi:hypothetical protein